MRKQNERYEQLKNTATLNTSILTKDDINLWLQLLFFSKTIEDARRTNMPNVIANYLEQLAQDSNSFYAKHSIKASSDNLFCSRYHLLTNISLVLKNGLACLNIDTLERM